MKCPCCGTEQFQIPTMKEIEKYYILSVLEFTKGNMKQTGLILGIAKSALYRKVVKYRKEKKDASSSD